MPQWPRYRKPNSEMSMVFTDMPPSAAGNEHGTQYYIAAGWLVALLPSEKV
jgi:hypothetical protein